MERHEVEARLKRSLFTARIITVAFVMSVVTYVIVLMVMENQINTGETEGVFLAQILTIVGFSLLAVSTALGKLLVPSDEAKIRSHTQEQLMGRIFVATVARLAFQEGGAIMGFVASFMSGDNAYCLALGAGAIFMMAIYWPKYEAWWDIVGKAEG